MTYSSVWSQGTTPGLHSSAGLNDLDVMSCDLQNAYLNASCKEKIRFVRGKECDEDQGKVLVIIRALYGLRSAGAS
eukprot:4286800-Ditylum_brightwellii.AAC.1